MKKIFLSAAIWFLVVKAFHFHDGVALATIPMEDEWHCTQTIALLEKRENADRFDVYSHRYTCVDDGNVNKVES